MTDNETPSGRNEKISCILHLQGIEDRRRLRLDDLDTDARRSNTWGSAEHRAGRDRTEREYERDIHAFDRASDAELDTTLKALSG